MKPKYEGLKPWMVMMERAQTVIPGYGKQKSNTEIHTPYAEQLKYRAAQREHARRVAAITGITRHIQEQHNQGLER